MYNRRRVSKFRNDLRTVSLQGIRFRSATSAIIRLGNGNITGCLQGFDVGSASVLWHDLRRSTFGTNVSQRSRNLRSIINTSSTAAAMPSGLVANWQMDGFNGSNEVVDVSESGNNRLSIGTRNRYRLRRQHAGRRPAYQRKCTTERVLAMSCQPIRTSAMIWSMTANSSKSDTGSWTDYTQRANVGGWTVESGAVSHTSQYESPSGWSQHRA